MAGKKYNDEGMLRKIKGLQQLSTVFRSLARDGVTYFTEKLENEILNKHQDSPPGEINGRYVRHITGHFITDMINVTKETDYVNRIAYNTGGASRGYGLRVIEWSRKKYGYTPYQIVRGKYNKHFTAGCIEAIKEWVKQFNQDPDKYKYYNPFNPEMMEPTITPADA